jgi:hypothetical protein
MRSRMNKAFVRVAHPVVPLVRGNDSDKLGAQSGCEEKEARN